MHVLSGDSTPRTWGQYVHRKIIFITMAYHNRKVHIFKYIYAKFDPMFCIRSTVGFLSSLFAHKHLKNVCRLLKPQCVLGHVPKSKAASHDLDVRHLLLA